MHKIWLVIKREYKTRVVSKGFLISTIAIPAVFVGMFLFEMVVSKSHPARTYKIAVMDETGKMETLITGALAEDKLSSGRPEFAVIEAGSRSRADLDAMTRAKSLDGYLLIPRGIAAGAKPDLVEGNSGILTSMGDVSKAVDESVIAMRLKAYGIDARRAGGLLRSIKLRITRLTGHGKTEEKGQVYIVAFIMASLLYGALIMYGITTMRSVLEEKTTRTMEVLISSIRPVQLMAGKILGVAAVGLTQFLIWAVSAAIIAAYSVAVSHAFGQGESLMAIHIPAALLAYFVLYFLGGYLLFASMYAAIGAMVADQNDAQQIQMPISFLLVASFLLFNLVGRDPSSSMSVMLTMVPFFSPILMVFRIAIQPPPFWQILLSLFILLLTTAGVVYASARVYRVGVLMYGKRPSLVEIVRWIRYS